MQTTDRGLGVLPRDLAGWALFIDIDGTLIDLAERPDGVEIPPDLPGHLSALSARAGGAMALVTGRSISTVDSMFRPFQFAVAGLHGAQMRLEGGGSIKTRVQAAALDGARRRLDIFAGQWPGLIVEDKELAIAVHYRQVPHMADAVHAELQSLVAGLGRDWRCQRGKMVAEICPSTASKAVAVAGFMNSPPFAGRRIVALGDDLTDEAMFRYANEEGGMSVRVGTGADGTVAMLEVAAAADVRAWIARVAAINPTANP